MKPSPCFICNRAPQITTTPASKDGTRVALVIQCPAHLNGQVSIYGENFGAVHRAGLLAWNDYQETMAASNEAAA